MYTVKDQWYFQAQVCVTEKTDVMSLHANSWGDMVASQSVKTEAALPAAACLSSN